MSDEAKEVRPRRPRRLKAREAPPVLAKGTRVCERIRIDHVTYERTYVPCGVRCRVCSRTSPEFDPERPGHGPYWYARYPKADGTQGRRYCGAVLRFAGKPFRKQPGTYEEIGEPDAGGGE